MCCFYSGFLKWSVEGPVATQTGCHVLQFIILDLVNIVRYMIGILMGSNRTLDLLGGHMFS